MKEQISLLLEAGQGKSTSEKKESRFRARDSNIMNSRICFLSWFYVFSYVIS